jgi:hypothetical protein
VSINVSEEGLLVTCFHAGFLLSVFSTLKMEAICSPKRQLTLNGLHSVIFQKLVLFNIKTDLVEKYRKAFTGWNWLKMQPGLSRTV